MGKAELVKCPHLTLEPRCLTTADGQQAVRCALLQREAKTTKVLLPMEDCCRKCDQTLNAPELRDRIADVLAASIIHPAKLKFATAKMAAVKMLEHSNPERVIQTLEYATADSQGLDPNEAEAILMELELADWTSETA